MSQADFIKKRNRRMRRVHGHIQAAMADLEAENGPLDWSSALRFVQAGELSLAVESLEWAVISQDLFQSVSAENSINEAKRLMGLFREGYKGIYTEPNPDDVTLPWRADAEERMK